MAPLFLRSAPERANTVHYAPSSSLSRWQVDADSVLVGKTVKVWDQLQEYAKRIQTHGHRAITESMRYVQPPCASSACAILLTFPAFLFLGEQERAGFGG